MKKITHLIILLVLTIAFVSCQRNTVYSEYTTIKDGVWAIDKGFSFSADITDTISTYQISIIVRNSDKFPRQNLWLSIDREHNDCLTTDTVNIFLLDEEGKWRGSGIGSTYDNNLIWQEKTKFPTKGEYKFTFKHLMRIEVLEGIERIGIEIIKEQI
ncbi:MAG: hypothetical protein CSA89_00505 [Bacteroidales bacterium]|nr:MAG: hypothetical protein CSA89_00505 [Bacteroidales bacterium]